MKRRTDSDLITAVLFLAALFAFHAAISSDVPSAAPIPAQRDSQASSAATFTEIILQEDATEASHVAPQRHTPTAIRTARYAEILVSE